MTKAIVYCSILFLGIGTTAKAQSLKEISNNLEKACKRIQYWHENSANDPDDSLRASNKKLEQLLLKYTSENDATLTYPFKELQDSTEMTVKTSKDGLFRIYSWYDWAGGTARNFYTVFQYGAHGKTYSTNLKTKEMEEDDAESTFPFFNVLHQINVGKKAYYVTQNITVASSAVYGFTTKIFAIDNGKLNDTAKLILTKTGLHNELSYEVDWSEYSNSHNNLPMTAMEQSYDTTNNIISIPLIDEDDRVTTRRIKYKFNGHYFVKIPANNKHHNTRQ